MNNLKPFPNKQLNDFNVKIEEQKIRMIIQLSNEWWNWPHIKVNEMKQKTIKPLVTQRMNEEPQQAI